MYLSSKKSLGIIVNEYHTEYLDFFFELFSRDFDLHVYIREDAYGIVARLHYKYAFVKHDIIDFARDMNQCIRYIVLSYSDMIYHFIEHYNLDIDKFVFITHNAVELRSYRNRMVTDNHLVLSRSIEGPRIVPIRNEIEDLTATRTDASAFIVMKLGWVSEDIEHYRSLLNIPSIILIVFTRGNTKTLTQLMNEYTNRVVVYIEKTTREIKQIIQKYNIAFVFNPKDSSLFTGSISFALDHNMILITQEEVIDYYNIPPGYAIAYDSPKFTALDVYINYIHESNKTELQTYKNKLSIANKKILLKILLKI